MSWITSAFSAVFHLLGPLLDWKCVIWGRADCRFHRGSHHGVFPDRIDTDRRFRRWLHEKFFRPFPTVGWEHTRPARNFNHPVVRLLRYTVPYLFMYCIERKRKILILTYTTLASYIVTLFITFVIIPLAYFFHKTETASSGRYIYLYESHLVVFFNFYKCESTIFDWWWRSQQNILPALCYTSLFAMILAGLLGIGYIVPTRDLPAPNSTLEEQFRNQLEDLKTLRNANS